MLRQSCAASLRKLAGAPSLTCRHPAYCTTTTAQGNGDPQQPPTPPGSTSSHKEGWGSSTLDEEEVAKFRAMAASWWDLEGDCKPLHALNQLRVPLVREGLLESAGQSQQQHHSGPRPLTGLSVLDVGCGGGILCEPLARLGAQVVGLDAAEENVTVARLHAERSSALSNNLQYVCGTVEQHVESVGGGLYDAVVASEVLEHVDHTHLFLHTCAEALKPGGSLFLTTINRTRAAWLGAVVLAEYTLRLLPPGTHNHDKFVPRQELLLMLEKCGLVTRLVHGLAYNPLLGSWSWVPNTSINYAVHAIKE